jgi:hypothetical protein
MRAECHTAISHPDIVVGAFLASRNVSAQTQRSEPMLTRNCRLLSLSVMKRRPVVVGRHTAGSVC